SAREVHMTDSKESARLVGPGVLHFERMLPGGVERAWSYLAEAKKRSAWFTGGEFDLRLGGPIWLELDPARPGPGLEGRITQLEPPHLLAYEWWTDDHRHEVSLELVPEGDAVRLLITHGGLEARNEAVGVASAWDAHTGVLADVLAGERPRAFWTTHA